MGAVIGGQSTAHRERLSRSGREQPASCGQVVTEGCQSRSRIAHGLVLGFFPSGLNTACC